MARRSLNRAGEDRDETGSNLAGSTDSMHAHLHMPRWRKTTSPLRASGGSASPSMAERSLS